MKVEQGVCDSARALVFDGADPQKPAHGLNYSEYTATWPSEDVFEVDVMSVCRRWNKRTGLTSICLTFPVLARLRSWQAVQLITYVRMSASILGQNQRSWMRIVVAPTPACPAEALS